MWQGDWRSIWKTFSGIDRLGISGKLLRAEPYLDATRYAQLGLGEEFILIDDCGDRYFAFSLILHPHHFAGASHANRFC